MIDIPAIPPARGYELAGSVTLDPRYEDITQDGRILLTSMMTGLGAVWRTLDRDLAAIAAFREQGVLPILRRIVLRGSAGPSSVYAPIRSEGTWRLAREADGDRLFMNMWLEARAPLAHTFGPVPSADAERVVVGRVFAEHVITKPFASPAERKVTRLDAPGIPSLPEDTYVFEEAEALLGGGGQPLPLEDVRQVRFGMMHTDSNQHVNSLVYPRLFEEALVDHLGDDAGTLLVRDLEIRFRKPFFVGQRARIALAIDPASRDDGADGAEGKLVRGAFFPEGTSTKPSCAILVRLTPGP